MQVKFLNMVLECWYGEFLDTTIIFQKSNIGWPQQPLTEEVLKFNMIFYDWVPNFYVSKKVFWSRIWVESWNIILNFSTFSVRGCWGQPMLLFWKMVVVSKNSLSQHSRIILSTQMTNTSPFLWNGSSKIQFFTDIRYFFCQRLLRPENVSFFEN